jgi:hypothetical protein
VVFNAGPVYYFIFVCFSRCLLKNHVTGLINMLPGNSSINTVQHATIEEAVFYTFPRRAEVEQRGYATRF